MAPPLSTAAAGEALPERRHHIDQALIDRYAELSRDRNPLHIDPEFAATTHYGGTIAHGMLTLALVSSALEAWAGVAAASTCNLDVAFLAPVYPSDTVTVRARIEQFDEDNQATLRVECAVGDRTVVAGNATIGVDGRGDAGGVL